MQAFKDKELIESMMGDLEGLQKRKQELLDSGKANWVVIGTLPREGEKVIINELSFTVQRTLSRGRLILKVD